MSPCNLSQVLKMATSPTFFMFISQAFASSIYSKLTKEPSILSLAPSLEPQLLWGIATPVMLH